MPTSTMAVMKPLSSSILPTDNCINLMSGGASAACAHPPAITATAATSVFQLLLIVVSSDQHGEPRPDGHGRSASSRCLPGSHLDSVFSVRGALRRAVPERAAGNGI
ncbi:hypothetical protein D3C87_1636120 [compost metagenome]